MMRNLLAVFVLSLLFLPQNIVAEEHDLTDEEFNETILFTGGAIMGVIFHELGHVIIDKYNIPVFSNEEDIADSFMAWYLIHIPEEYKTREDYENASAGPHLVIKYTTDYYYYKKLLGKEVSDEYSTHSTDTRRFFNIACFMKGANPEVFESYIVKRNLGYIIEEEDCLQSYWQMNNAWSTLLEGYWARDITQLKGKLLLEYEESDDALFQYFAINTQELIEAYFNIFEIILPNDILVRFEGCKGGDTNAYYFSEENKIKVCYDLLSEFAQTKIDILDLKSSL